MAIAKLKILHSAGVVHTCVYCGGWTTTDQSDQEMPVDVCSHELDLDSLWKEYTHHTERLEK